MKKFTLLAAAALFAALNVNATVLYVATEASGTGDGSSWDNAIGVNISEAGDTTFIETYINDLAAGDIVYLKEGTYYGKRITPNPGTTIIGGFPKDATGTDISGYNPWTYKTTLDADKKNTIDSNRQAFIKVIGATSDNTPNIIKGVTITNCTAGTTTANVGPTLNCTNAYLVIEDVVFKNNYSYKGGCVAPAEGSKFYAKHCVWTGNETRAADKTASCLSVRGASGKITNAVLEGCVMVNDSVSSTMSYGGYINAQDNYTNLMMVNCYVDGGNRSISQNGGGIRTGKGHTLHLFAFNTFCNFQCTASEKKGHIMSIGNTNGLYLQGNIITSSFKATKNDDKSVNALFFQNDTLTKYDNVKSYGYNTVTGMHFLTTSNVGTFRDNATGTDNWLAPTTEEVFGSNKMTEKDGLYYIEPTAAYGDVVLDDALKAFEDFEMPDCFKWANVDLSLDIFGNKRAATTYRGAYDPNGTPVVDETTGIENVTDNSAKISVKSLGNGNFAITGTEGNAEVYDLSGRLVSKQALNDGTLHLDNVASGIYLVRFPNATLKLAR
jgi:hypothetical protein